MRIKWRFLKNKINKSIKKLYMRPN